MKTLKLTLSIFFLSVLTCYPGYSQDIRIEGPSVTCPNESVTYKVHAKNFLGKTINGSFTWSVFINDVHKPELSGPAISCGGTTVGQKERFISIVNSTNGIEGWQEEGNIRFVVRFARDFLNPFCGTVTKTMHITSRAIDPIPPRSNGELIFCSGGETKEVFINNLTNVAEDCFWHHQWTWTVPTGWIVKSVSQSSPATESSIVTRSTRVLVTAPNNISSTANYTISVNDYDYPYDIGSVARMEVGTPATSRIRFADPISHRLNDQQWNLVTATLDGNVSLHEYTWQWQVPNSQVRHSDPTASYVNVRPTLNQDNDIYIRVRACNSCGCSGWVGQWYDVRQAGTGGPRPIIEY